MIIHPARQLSYFYLVGGLSRAIEGGWVNEQRGGAGLALYCYTKNTVYERHWDEITLLARGLIIDHATQRVVATPFLKFFNVGEGEDQKIPDLPFETYEKVDGSLIILFWHDGGWRTATKGSFNSDQARAAAEHLMYFDTRALVPGHTYLAEWVSPENRIVVRYENPELVLLAGYNDNGIEVPYDTLTRVAEWIGWRAAKRHSFNHVSDLVAHAQGLPSSEEGFVLRFANGLRLKVKGDEYRRIHMLISRCTPLAMWEAMRAGDDLDLVRRELPEEFWTDFDAITSALQINLNSLIREVTEEARVTQHLTDKEIGLHEGLRHKGYVFALRKFGSLTEGRSRTREALFRAIRPTGNKLDGYEPSSGITRVFEEAA